MVVSKPFPKKPLETVATCNGSLMERVDSFKYLRLHFHKHGSMPMSLLF